MENAVWMWGALGLLLLAIEMGTGTFYVLWFGVAALFMSIALWILPNMSLPVQFIIYGLMSLGSLAIWQLFYKKNETHSRVGQAQGEEIGRTGTVIVAVSASQNGKIRFAQGVMGSREWTAVANETIAEGAEASIIAVEGNAVRVRAV
jgi:inner membrane protein